MGNSTSEKFLCDLGKELQHEHEHELELEHEQGG
jgi:hypothetical protein